MQSEQAAWLALLDEIGEENMTQPDAASGWSIKDIVAHITGWRRRTVLRFRAALDPTRDMTPPWPAELGEVDEDDDVDEINGSVSLSVIPRKERKSRLEAIGYSW
jgi:hypothetical protein